MFQVCCPVNILEFLGSCNSILTSEWCLVVDSSWGGIWLNNATTFMNCVLQAWLIKLWLSEISHFIAAFGLNDKVQDP